MKEFVKGLTYQELDALLVEAAKKQPRAMNGGYMQALEAQLPSQNLTGGPVQVASVVGANVLVPNSGVVLITAAGVAACTLALPIAGTDDGKVLMVISTTANAHTVTTPANGLNKTLHIATFAATVGAYVILLAYQGTWYVLCSNTAAFANNVTLS